VSSKITLDHLGRRAVVYVRQSTPIQVLNNLESQRRQYGLADYARELGFNDVFTIDDDLGKSGSGLVERPGFQRLVAEVCGGQIGAVLCIEASRLARNGRDWHHLIELCGLVGAIVIDPEGVYDPRSPNDRLLLGLKGTMNEFEVHLFRQRSLEAMRQKARRGEFQCNLPAGYCWAPSGKIEIYPDRRVQHAIRSVFERFSALGSARQVLMEFRSQGIQLPVHQSDPSGSKVEWRAPVYNAILQVLVNPVFAGAYAFGKTESRTTVVNGRAKKTIGHRKPIEEWAVLIKDHHPGYITWEQFDRNQIILSENNFMRTGSSRKAGRGGHGLLTGLLRCRRCGRMLYTYYAGRGDLVRYMCRGLRIVHGGQSCISFAGAKPERQVVTELLRAVEGNAVDAAIQAAERVANREQTRMLALSLELEQVRYQARLAQRRYESADPENRLVAGELETRWNAALRHVADLEEAFRTADGVVNAKPLPDQASLMRLAADLESLWHAPGTDLRLKQRIVRTLVEEIVVDVDQPANQVVMLIHWSGGRHTELRITKPKTGEHGHKTTTEAVEVVKQMAGQYPDDVIAGTLNRLGFSTGYGNTWKKHLVCSLRSKLDLPAYDPSSKQAHGALTAEQAAERLGVSMRTVRELLRTNVLMGTQVVKFAPWQIPIEALNTAAVVERIQRIHDGKHLRTQHNQDEHTLRLPGM
jgi:DNA invertase Pin-like site-specific DNA recombinase